MITHLPQPPRPQRRAKRASTLTRIAVALLTLIVANFFSLFILAFYFLPEHSGEISPRLVDLLESIHIGIASKWKFKRRIRSSSDSTTAEVGDPAQALKQALSNNGGGDEFVRYDIVPTILDQTRGYYGVVHQLPSIPDRRRMIPNNSNNANQHNIQWYNNSAHRYTVPTNAVHNLTYFLESRERPDEEDRPLYIYNPMLLPLDSKRMDSSILSNLRLWNDNGKNYDAAYIAVYRVSNFGNCHGPGRGVPGTYHNYLGLALLDHDLNILPDMESDTPGEYLDVVIDLNQHLYDIHWKPGGGIARKKPPMPKQFMQDCQLFVGRSETLENADQLILLCNEYAMPVKLERRKRGSDNIGKNNAKNSGANDKNVDVIHFTNTYGSGLQLTALELPNVVAYKGKNMHYYQRSGNSEPGFLEVWPGGPHEFLYMDFTKFPYVDRSNGAEPPSKVISNKPEPDASFKTIDSKGDGNKGISTLIDRDSGSACCVPIQWKDEDSSEERTLMLGFSHRKTRKHPKKEGKYEYVTRVYAFEPKPPFDIVARSGFFCLGFAGPHGTPGFTANSHLDDAEALQSDNEQIWGAANDYKLTIHDTEFDCPRIHFVTGVAEKMGDSSTVIISYGVNDCYPRMIEVPKEFLVALLRS